MHEWNREHHQPKPTPPKPAPAPAPVPEVKTSTSTMFGAQGQLMQVDAVKSNHCFNCGEVGHWRRNCPKLQKKLNVCMLAIDLTDEECQELLGITAEEKAVEEITDFI
jgi:hypothetical protein